MPKTAAGFEIATQLIRSSGSVGSHYSASGSAKSKRDFIYKIEVVLEVADESQYWLEVIKEADLLSCKESDSLIPEACELVRIFNASDKTAKMIPSSHRKQPIGKGRYKISGSGDPEIADLAAPSAPAP